MTITEHKAELEAYTGQTTCPSDFQEFWQTRWNQSAPTEIKRESIPFKNDAAVYELLSIRTADGSIVRARTIHPAGKGPYPTVLMFHDQGRGIRGWHHMTRFIAPGYAVIALDNTVALPLDAVVLEQSYMAAFTVAQAVKVLPYFDAKQLTVWGEGFGGGLAIVAAAMLPSDLRCAVLNPMPADSCEWLSEESKKVWEYYDLVCFASLLKGPLLMGTALMDKISAPNCQYAIYNRATCPKSHFIYPKYEHERINFFENELLKFLCH